MTPLVYVLVINWNGLEHLEACFDSLCRSTYANLRLLLIDNASTDASLDFVRQRYGADPRVEILPLQENAGWSGGNNAGIRHAVKRGADYLFLLNNDTWTAEDCVSRLVAMAESRPAAALLAPKMLMFDAPHILNSVGLECSLIGACWDRGIGRHDHGQYDVPARSIGVCGGAMFIRAAVLAEVGELPEAFGIYLDDLDLCLRAINAGHEIWTCPQARVHHKFSAGFGTGARARHKYYLNTRNRFWLLLRHFPASVALHVVLGEVRAVGRGVLNREWWKVPAHVRAWCAALSYLPTAIRFRRTAPGGARFWPMILRRPYFCPALELPRDGWYEERICGGQRLQPMSAHAQLPVHRGRLRVIHANCYPALGPTAVQATLDHQPLVDFATTAVHEEVLVIPRSGTLRLQASQMFLAESTGETIDIGGWFRFIPSTQ